jgi:transcriptional regulator with XRE-family HTH domain
MRKYNPLSAKYARMLGTQLRTERKMRGHTLIECSTDTGVNVGQLSRFEHGAFKTMSENLQIYAKYLRISVPDFDDDLEERFRRFAERSSQHRSACKLILEALEKLG